MNEAYADYVYPVIAQGLRLRAQLERGQEPDLEIAQRDLVAALDGRREDTEGIQAPRTDIFGDGPDWLGLRYALVCWLDEIFTDETSPWEPSWNPQALEVRLYGTRDRAWKFPMQSELALRTRGVDVVETFFLLWMLGFRGRLRDNPEKLAREHVEPARKAIDRARGGEWPAPAQREPRSYVPPLSGRERFNQMILVWVVTALPLIIAIIVAIFHNNGQ